MFHKYYKEINLMLTLSKCSNLIYTFCEVIFEKVGLRSEGAYARMRLNDNAQPAKKKPQKV